MLRNFPFFPQHDAMDCGPACLRMVAQHYGRHYTLESLRQKCHISREGVSLLGISEAAEGIGFKTVGVHIGFEQLKEELPLALHNIEIVNKLHFSFKKQPKHLTNEKIMRIIAPSNLFERMRS